MTTLLDHCILFYIKTFKRFPELYSDINFIHYFKDRYIDIKIYKKIQEINRNIKRYNEIYYKKVLNIISINQFLQCDNRINELKEELDLYKGIKPVFINLTDEFCKHYFNFNTLHSKFKIGSNMYLRDFKQEQHLLLNELFSEFLVWFKTDNLFIKSSYKLDSINNFTSNGHILIRVTFYQE